MRKYVLAIIMKKLVKVVSIGIILGVITGFLLILSGLGTSSVLTNEGTYQTRTTISLDPNTFALLMILGVAVTAIIASYIFIKDT